MWSSGENATLAAARLVMAAQRAVDETARATHEPFAAECLTLFLNNACNLRCQYCHAMPGAASDASLSAEALRSTADLVAGSCAERQSPFTVAFHGGGEPSLDTSIVDRILELVQASADRFGVNLRTYIATNGVMSEDRAQWLADRFALVGLSCDGPPDIQDRQRPARDGRSTSSRVQRTAAILRRAGTAFHVRATITRETCNRQPEIVEYFIEHYAPSEIRLEPVYVNPAGGRELCGAYAPGFVAGFLQAWKTAARSGVSLTTSLTRPGALYGRHCNVLRHVVNLVPGDVATGCFLESREADINRRQVRVGAMSSTTNRFHLDTDRIAALAAQCAGIPSHCRDCFCRFQCTYGCPDVCPLQEGEKLQKDDACEGLFRCRAHRLLMEALIREAAAAAWRSTPAGTNQDIWISESMLRVAVYRDGPRGGTSP